MAPFHEHNRRGIGFHLSALSRRRKIPKDNILGVTKPSIRRLARRGGIKRISASIYDEIRKVLKLRLGLILEQLTHVINLTGRKTITTTDVVFVLRRLGSPIYGFNDPVAGQRV